MVQHLIHISPSFACITSLLNQLLILSASILYSCAITSNLIPSTLIFLASAINWNHTFLLSDPSGHLSSVKEPWLAVNACEAFPLTENVLLRWMTYNASLIIIQ